MTERQSLALYGRFAVPKQVVCFSNARVDVFPVRNVVHSRERVRGNQKLDAGSDWAGVEALK